MDRKRIDELLDRASGLIKSFNQYNDLGNGPCKRLFEAEYGSEEQRAVWNQLTRSTNNHNIAIRTITLLMHDITRKFNEGEISQIHALHAANVFRDTQQTSPPATPAHLQLLQETSQARRADARLCEQQLRAAVQSLEGYLPEATRYRDQEGVVYQRAREQLQMYNDSLQGAPGALQGTGTGLYVAFA